MADIINTIQTRVLGEEVLRQLTADIERQEKAFIALASAMRASGASEDQILAKTRAHAAAIKDLGAQVKNVERTMGAAGAGKDRGRGLLIFGQGVQDFEAAGMRGITNQIDQFAQALGVGAGLAGVLTIAGVAIQVFLPQIQALIASFQGDKLTGFVGHLETISARVKELKKTIDEGGGTAADVLELRNLQKEEQRLESGGKFFEKMLAEPTPTEEATGKAVTEALDVDERDAALDALFKQQLGEPGSSRQEQVIKTEMDRLDKEIAKGETGKFKIPGTNIDVSLVKTGRETTRAGVGGMNIFGKRKQLEQDLKKARAFAEDNARREAGALLEGATGGDPTKAAALAERLDAAGFTEMAKKVRAAPQARMDAEAQEAAGVEWEAILAEDKASRELDAEANLAAGEEWDQILDEDKKQTAWDKKLTDDWAKLDVKLAKVGDTFATKQATNIAKDQIAMMQRDPRMFAGTEDFLASVQQAGGAKDRESERELMEQMVSHLKKIAEADAAGVGP